MRVSLGALFVATTFFGLGLAAYIGISSSAVVKETGRELDLAIVGPGFFELRHYETDELAFTRFGRFYIDSGGCVRLFGTDYLLEPPIHVSDYDEVRVTPTGYVQCRAAEDTSWSGIGTICLSKFRDPDQLEHLGASIFRDSKQSGIPFSGAPAKDGLGLIQSGWLERGYSFPMWFASLATSGAVVVMFASVLFALLVLSGRVSQLGTHIHALEVGRSQGIKGQSQNDGKSDERQGGENEGQHGEQP